MNGQCHLCRRFSPVAEMGCDADGDHWCRDWVECNRIAKDRLADRDSVWRWRREVARLERQQNPLSVAELFELDVDPMGLFGLDELSQPASAAPVFVPVASVEQLGLL